MELPKMMRAFVQNDGPNKSASVKDHPVPSLDTNEVLIKVHYAAQNPTDWKHSAFLSPPGAIIGCDFSGEIVRLGPNLTNASLKVGDRVAGCVHGGLFPDKGAFAEYCKQESDLVWRVPEKMGMDEAATFGVPWVTACQALIADQDRRWPPAEQQGWYLLYGASSSVGLFALQLARAMKYYTIAICSPHSFDLVRDYCADDTVDYHDAAACIDKVKRITAGGVRIGLDTISEGESVRIALSCFAPPDQDAQAGGDEDVDMEDDARGGKRQKRDSWVIRRGKQGRLNMILPPKDEMRAIRPDVEISDTLMYTLFGKRFTMSPTKPNPRYLEAKPEDRKFGADIMARTPSLIEKHEIKGNPVEVRGGLQAIEQGFKDMREGKISGKKLVYRIGA